MSNSNSVARNKSHFVIDTSGLVLLFLLIAAYLLFSVSFAELHISLFRTIPVFVGEIVLTFCLVLFIFRSIVTGAGVRNSILWSWIIYGSWILAKAVSGYIHDGGYALRNAALFYYPFTAFFTYVFFRGIFDRRNGRERVLSEPDLSRFFLVVGMIVALGQAAVAMEPFGRYCLLACLAGFFLSLGRPLLISLGLLAVLFGGVMAGLLDCVSRTQLLCLMSAVVFLVIFFFSIWQAKMFLKWMIGALLCVLLLGFIVSRSDPNTVKSLVTPVELQKAFQAFEERLQKEGPHYVIQSQEAKIYNPNPPGFSFIASWFDFVLASVKEEKHPDSSHETAPNAAVPLPAGVSEASEMKRVDSKGKQPMSVPDPAPKAVASAKIVSAPPTVKSANSVNKEPASVSKSSPKASGMVAAPVKAFSAVPAEGSVGSKVGQSIRQQYSAKAEPRPLDTAYNNMLFRYFIWRDMAEEFFREKPVLFGFSFGRPQRSRSVEILGWAWGEWSRDGWIAPHNSYLHLIYRGGLVGLGVIVVTLMLLARMALIFASARASIGACLVSALIFGLVAANFLVFLELPYTAIPFWFLFGLTWAYARAVKKTHVLRTT
jgi:hypothetical protein